MNELLKDFRSIEIKTKKLIAHSFMWNFRSAFKWNGLEFSEFKERQEWDDITGIDWLVSKREGKLLKRKMVEERELHITFLIDLWKNMEAPFEKSKKEMLFELYSLISLSAVENKDKISCLFFWWERLEVWKFYNSKSGVFRYFREAKEYNISKKNSSLDSALHHLCKAKCKHNLLFILTDSFDYNELYLKQVAYKNEIVFIHIFNNFENTLFLKDKAIIPFWNEVESFYIDLYDEKKRVSYVELRRERLRNFSTQIVKLGWDYLYIDDTKNIFKEFFLFMKKRELQ